MNVYVKFYLMEKHKNSRVIRNTYIMKYFNALLYMQLKKCFEINLTKSLLNKEAAVSTQQK